MGPDESRPPQTFAELAPSQRWQLQRHPSIWGLALGWGLFCGIFIGLLIWSFDLVFALTDRLGGIPFGSIWIGLTTVQLALAIGVFALATNCNRALVRNLINEFLEYEAEQARRDAGLDSP